MNKCPKCGCDLETLKVGLKCKNTLITDLALAYLKKVKYGEKAISYQDFEKCSYFKFKDKEK
ncbi:MAG: hypothetical protein EVJ48_01970 [Candidatus Acidulodesulfobacterium acidiphilum]|uniref:Uncharacterized protein n=1 Tax=Candidatus Acidulodesulfobacterium acidiphilum TaxID=2597224 RepID=A0A520XGP1_9DELT|nr:MAG: hypothetical protein EVJ48_01970 [Candidatus Acidulodesulfobacterium acidiphilum]